MKKLFLLPLAFLLACENQNESTPSEENHEDASLSMGYDLSLDSRSGYEFMRLHDPNTGIIPHDIKKREMAFAQTLPFKATRAFGWDQRGPVNIGGRTRALAIDVLNPNHWIAGGVTGGIWATLDGGESWQKVTAQNQLHSVTTVVQDTRTGKENVWYAGTGELYGIVSAATFDARFSGDGILKSTDNGVTWSELASTQSNTPATYAANGDMDFIWKMVIDPSDASNDVVLAAAYNGVFYSNDGGATWSESLGFTMGPLSAPTCDYLDLVVTSTGVFYATFSSDGPSKGVFRSEDGLTWTDIKPASYPTSYGRITMAINPQNENDIWFFGAAATGFANNHMLMKYTYVSGDGAGAGGTWIDRSMFLPDEDCDIPGFTTNLAQLNTQSSFDVHVAVHPDDEDVIYIAGTSIWRSTDGFTSLSNYEWIGGYQCWPGSYDDIDFATSWPNHHPDQHLLLFDPTNSNVLINANDGGIYKTVDNLADSMEWISLNNGYMTTQFYAVAIEPGETTSDIIIGGMQDNSTWYTNTTEFDSAWVRLSGGDGMYCAITENEDYYVTSIQNGRLFLGKVDADGNVLEVERIDPESGPSSYNWANSLKLDPNNSHILYWNARNRVMRVNLDDIVLSGDKTNKEPDHWENILNSNVPPGNGVISDIEVCLAAPNRIWYGTNSGNVFRVDDVDGTSPVLTEITGEEFHPAGYVSCISVNPLDPNKILVSFANYGIKSIFRTLDGGESWEHISGNLEENEDGSGSGPAVFWMEYYPDGTLFAGTSVGLFTTRNVDGVNTVWEFESGIGNVVINHMDFRLFDGKFVVGTHGNGVFSTTMTPAVAGINSLVQADFNLYPSITTGNVTFETNLNQTIVTIYNLNGQLIKTLELQSGQTKADFTNWKKGTYIAVSEAKGNRQTKKFVIQ